MDCNGSLWVLIVPYASLLVCMSPYRALSVFMDFNGSLWVLLGSYLSRWFLVGPHEFL